MKQSRPVGALVLLLIASPSVYAENQKLHFGAWNGGDTAAESIYQTLRISPQHITWGNRLSTKPDCHTTYQEMKEPPGTTFKDQLLTTEFSSTPNPDYETHMLKVANSKCTLGVRYLRVTIHFKSPDLLALVEYSANQKPIGYMHFNRGSDIDLDWPK